MSKPLDGFLYGNLTPADSPWRAFWALVFEAADALDQTRQDKTWQEEQAKQSPTL